MKTTGTGANDDINGQVYRCLLLVSFVPKSERQQDGLCISNIVREYEEFGLGITHVIERGIDRGY